jgi:hypothetical protein
MMWWSGLQRLYDFVQLIAQLSGHHLAKRVGEIAVVPQLQLLRRIEAIPNFLANTWFS